MPANSGGIPEKIKIGDQEVVVKDHPELLELLQKARKEEKDKLYSQISSLDAKVKVLEDEKKNNGELSATKEKELKELREELGAVKAEKEKLEKAGKGGSGADLDDDDDDDTKGKTKSNSKSSQPSFTKEEMADMLKNALDEQQKVFDEKLKEVKGGLNKKTVSDYRKEQLAKHEGLIIDKLVPEDLDSEEAVNKAIADALEVSKNYISKEYEVDGKKQKMTLAEYEQYEEKQKNAGAGGSQQQGGTGNYTPPIPPAKPEGGSGDLTGKELLSKIEDMSDEEYAKYHKEILKEVQSVKYGDEKSS